jgi:hypothetical protein
MKPRDVPSRILSEGIQTGEMSQVRLKAPRPGIYQPSPALVLKDVREGHRIVYLARKAPEGPICDFRGQAQAAIP